MNRDERGQIKEIIIGKSPLINLKNNDSQIVSSISVTFTHSTPASKVLYNLECSKLCAEFQADLRYGIVKFLYRLLTGTSKYHVL